jgi:UDP-N-acetylmuramyl pentapeptide phosphotransferase/UDP-N-acetylglucosamine-1-phosphate transferase
LAGAASACGFLLHNWPPAAIFMGDVGSVFLGAMLGGFTAIAVREEYVSLVASGFLLLPFIFDATFTLLRRMALRERFWRPHRSHLYQLLCQQGLAVRNVTAIYLVAAAFGIGVGLWLDRLTVAAQFACVVNTVAAAVTVGILIVRRARRAAQEPQANTLDGAVQ